MAAVGSAATTQPVERQEWGAPRVAVTHEGQQWVIAGQKQTVTLDASNLAMSIRTSGASWTTLPSGSKDMLVKSRGEEVLLRLADARQINVEPYDAGFKTGVKITLGDWRDKGLHDKGQPIDLTVYLTLALEGADEDLAFDVAANEHETLVRRLDWPFAFDPSEIDCTLLPNQRGVLLPRDWPKAYFPVRAANPDGSAKASDISEIQSNIIECWSMSWWGMQQGESVAMVIIETPDDAGYQFDHPAGGPTIIGPRWRASLGQLRYPRAGRFCFFPKGNYVDMAKRYRRYVIEKGLFVPLTEKIARRPIVKELIGTPLMRSGILTDIKPDSLRYSSTQPERNHHVTTFDDRGNQFKALKDQGLQNLCVVLTGWPHLGYDRQHPDELPPATEAGGWEGLKRLQDTCKDLGYLFSLHDQYRDYYVDAPSYDPQFADHEEDATTPSIAFAGSRFGQWKEGNIPFMNNWDGGKQAYLNNRFMPGHLRKNYAALFTHGIHPQGIYLDVFGYIGPDEDFNPEHPTTRTQAREARADCYNWARANLGFIGTEAACDWTVPYSDFSSPLKPRGGIPVPLFELVYHDAIMTTYPPEDVRGLLGGGMAQISVGRGGGNPSEGGTFTAEYLAKTRRMAALQKRVALLEMTRHEFLDTKYQKERTTFSDGTTVSLDKDGNTIDIQPPLDVGGR